jgi:hypothetical protein
MSLDTHFFDNVFHWVTGLTKQSLFRRGWLIALYFIFLSNLQILSQSENYSTLEGIVINRTTGEPIQNVNIVVLGTTYGGVTDEQGKYRLYRMSEGTHTIVFSHLGYALHRLTQDFEPGENYFHDVEMFEKAIRFNELQVTADALYTERRSATDSYLITRRDIVESGIHNFGDLLRSYIPRISVQEDGFDLIISLTRETSLSQRYGGQQNPLIILDGINIGNSSANLNGIIRPEDIRKVEVIRGPSAMMYGMEGEQGVIIVDTIRSVQFETIPYRTIIIGAFVLSYLLYFVLFW